MFRLYGHHQAHHHKNVHMEALEHFSLTPGSAVRWPKPIPQQGITWISYTQKVFTSTTAFWSNAFIYSGIWHHKSVHESQRTPPYKNTDLTSKKQGEFKNILICIVLM